MTEKSGSWMTVAALGLTQILAWGATYYLLAVLTEPIVADTGWPTAWVIGGLSLGLLVAGLVSPRTGRTIQRHGGRPVLATSSLLLGLGLAGLAASPNLIAYLASWVVLGLGMGAGLYDAAFATLGRLYGGKARSAITALTLIAGFSSTICWPLSALLVESYGWRAACLAYAAIHVTLSLGLHLALVPRLPAAAADPATAAVAADPEPSDAGRGAFHALAIALTVIAIISAIMSVHIISLLRSQGLDLGPAVALAALLGPSQVAARLVEMSFGRHYHPIWTLIFATGLITAGLALLLIGLPFVAAAVVLYGGGNGIAWIARGTVPLAIFSQRQYATQMGRLAFPSLIAQALSPSLGAVLLDVSGAGATLAALLGAALLAVAAAIWLRRMV